MEVTGGVITLVYPLLILIPATTHYRVVARHQVWLYYTVTAIATATSTAIANVIATATATCVGVP